MENYTVTVKESFKELSKREKVRFKSAQEKVSLSDEVKKAPVTFQPNNVVVLAIHNPHTKERQEDGTTKRIEKDYLEIIVETKEGVLYSTSSESLYSSLMDIMMDMDEDEDTEPYEVRVFEKPSANFAGNFLTCELL